MLSNNEFVKLPVLKAKQISLHLKREDLIHPLISGNKYRKLKYNLVEATHKNFNTLLTFGGAFSNHIAATAYAGKKNGFKTIGIIRGEELLNKWQKNPTLLLASQHGMHFKFVSRSDYRLKDNPRYIKQLKKEFGSFYVLPEGGSNELAVKGCEEILTPNDMNFDVICSSVGTGATLAGIINASQKHQQILGFSALKGNFLNEDIRKFAVKNNWKLQTDYHFGGYAKYDKNLINFINDFKSSTQILLDPIYTAKMVYGILNMVQKNIFMPHTSILAIHTGGLQSIQGMNTLLKNKNLPIINV